MFIKVQGQGGSGTQYKGVFDVIGHLYKEGGIRSIYRGTLATMARDGPGSAACVSFTSCHRAHSNHFIRPKDTSQLMKSRKRRLRQPTRHLRISTLAKLSWPAGQRVWPCGPLLYPQMSVMTRLACQLSKVRRLISRALGSKIKITICTHRDIFWYSGLCTEDYRRRWCESTVEGFWTGHGSSESLRRDSKHLHLLTESCQAFPANAATFVSHDLPWFLSRE